MAYINLNGKLVKTASKNRWRGPPTVAKAISANVEAAQKKALKGVRHGNCNVTACQKPFSATWWNTSTRAWYCPHCAYEINRWSKHDEGYEICFPSEEAAEAAKAKFTLAAQADWG